MSYPVACVNCYKIQMLITFAPFRLGATIAMLVYCFEHVLRMYSKKDMINAENKYSLTAVLSLSSFSIVCKGTDQLRKYVYQDCASRRPESVNTTERKLLGNWFYLG